MRALRRTRILIAAAIAALLLACQLGPRTPAPTPRATPSPTAGIQRQAATPTPTLTRTPIPPPATPTPSPTASAVELPPLPDDGPLPAPWTEIDLAHRNQGFDKTLVSQSAYYPTALAFDGEAALLYVLARCRADTLYEEFHLCIASFDLETDRVRQTTAVPDGYEGKLLLAADALYLYRPWAGDLYALDRQTLAAGEAISDVLAVAFDGEETTYAVTQEGLARLRPDPAVRPQETSFADSPIAMAADSERVYVLGYEALKVFSADLAPLATIDFQAKSPRSLALGGERGQVYVGCASGLYALDVETHRLAPVSTALENGQEVTGIEKLALDAAGARLYALAYRPGDWFGGTDVIAIEVESGQARTLFSALSGRFADLSLDEERGRLLILSSDDHALIPIALEASTPSSRVQPRLPLGIEVGEAIVDPAADRLYVSDSAGWVHVLDRRTYAEVGRVYGGRHIGLDAVHQRLYAGDPHLPAVTVLDAGSLSVERTIPQPGKPRANPATGQVIVANRRFYVFDGASGEASGELLPGIGQPPEEFPGGYYTIAQEVVIDARRGLTATTTYTPWPGKPGPRESIDYDPDSGRAYYALLTGGYVHYSSIATYSDLGSLQERDVPLRYLEGLSGYIRLDPAARRLYVARGDVLFVLDSETLNRLGRVRTAGWTPAVAAVDGELGRLYIPHNSALQVWTREGAAPPAPPPPDPPFATVTITGTVTAITPSPNYARDRTLLATIQGQLCRSTDGGETWQSLRGGLPEYDMYGYAIDAAFSPDYANDRTLFAAISLGDTLGEGVYCSTDGGETWQPRSNGLYDLRAYQVVLSPDYARDRTLWAYARIQRGEALYRSANGGDNWELVVRQTSPNTPPLPRPEELFFAAQYPPQFKCDYDGACQRSDDGGETWARFDTGDVRLDRLVVYALSPHRAADGVVYFATESDLYRYQEGTGTWSRCTLPIFGDRDYTRALTSLATAATSEGEHVVFIGSFGGEFFCLAASDLPWQEVRPAPAVTRQPPTPTPCTGAVDERFQVDDTELPDELGCAVEAGVGTLVAFQPFESGVMFWRQDERQIYVLQGNGTWIGYEDTWVEGQPEADPNLVPPEGLYQPIHGFGKVWREQLGGPAAQIGWATQREYAFDTVIQVFSGGLLIKGDADTLYALYYGGRWESRP
jgi:photosystem II stability/assembly factor-like uncharacterized protein